MHSAKKILGILLCSSMIAMPVFSKGGGGGRGGGKGGSKSSTHSGHGSGLLTGVILGSMLFGGRNSSSSSYYTSEVIDEQSALWNEYQRNIETLKHTSDKSQSSILKKRNEEILDIFRKLAKAKYIADFTMELKEVNSTLIEKKSVTGINYHGDIETQQYSRNKRIYKMDLKGPDKDIKHFHVKATDPNSTSIDINTSGLYVTHLEHFGDKGFSIIFTNNENTDINFTRTKEISVADPSELSPIPPPKPISEILWSAAPLLGIAITLFAISAFLP